MTCIQATRACINNITCTDHILICGDASVWDIFIVVFSWNISKLIKEEVLKTEEPCMLEETTEYALSKHFIDNKIGNAGYIP